MVQIYKDEAVIFDLDDLLYKEFDFVRSGYWTIAHLVSNNPKKLFNLMMAQYFLGNRVIDWLINDYLKSDSKYSNRELLEVYRNHIPDITMNTDVLTVLDALKNNGNLMGVVTDGRSITQRNKISALRLDRWIDEFRISEETGFEKPSLQPFEYFVKRFNASNFIYIADNYNKDFIAPNHLGWRTIALADNGLNVHTKNSSVESGSEPSEIIRSFRELSIKSTCISDH